MKNLLLLLLLLTGTAHAQTVRIHAHNDYEKPKPLFNALQYKAYIIEADVYPGKNLFVSHDKKDIDSNRTLLNLYIEPIVALFQQHNNHISDDTSYAPLLMIDIKENSAAVIKELLQLLAPYKNVFDRTVNRHAIQVVLSGERGNSSGWLYTDSIIMYDGRPYEQYADEILKRVAVISDSYMNYLQPTDSINNKINRLVTETHQKGKLLRLWAIPDNEQYWQKFYDMGVDIINTDKVSECALYFQMKTTK